MEVDVGEHCSFSSCNRLDFLPFVCDLCQRTFCKDHSVPSSHNCEHVSTSISSTVPGEKQEFLYPCSLPSCKKRDVTAVQCASCQQCYCIAHRHQQDHDCSGLIVTQQQPSHSTAKAVRGRRSGEPVTAPRGVKGGSSSKHTSTKVALMKLKMKAVGLDSIPQTERVYFEVQLPRVSALPNAQLFFSKEWTVGRTVDSIAQRFKLRNDNHKPNAPKLFLYSEGEALSMPDKLEKLRIAETISLRLEYE